MRVLIDTNVILDWLQCRAEFSDVATKIITLALLGKIDAFVTFHSLSDIAYIIRKDFSLEKRKEILKMLCEKLSVISENSDSILDAIQLEFMKDFEDSLQVVSAKAYSLDCIITRNTKDFVESGINVVEPTEFLENYNNEHTEEIRHNRLNFGAK